MGYRNEEMDQGVGVREYLTEAKETLLLALPLIAGQLGQMFIGLADTVMIGRVGTVALAASTFANTLLMVPLLFGVGLLTSVSIRVAKARGGQRHDDVKHALRHGTWLAFVYGLIVFVICLAVLPLLGNFGQVDEVVEAVPTYFLLVAVSLVPAMMAMAWKNYGDALNKPWVPFWIILAGVGLNVLLNWIFIYGNWGSPELGMEGAGVATLIARIVTVVMLFAWIILAPSICRWRPRRWWGSWKRGEFRVLLRLGVPIGLQLLAEMGAFTAATLMVGGLGVIALAAHQVAFICTSVAFMVPLGIAMAITVRMGAAAGVEDVAGRVRQLRSILIGGWGFGLIFSTLSMVLFISCGRFIAQQIVTEPAVVDLATSLLVIAGLFQVVDGSQVISSSALRGMGDVVVPAWAGAFAYWGVSVPLGFYLIYHAGSGAAGAWWGLAIGLGVAAVLLGVRAWRVSARFTGN